jgi:hypothetical protein
MDGVWQLSGMSVAQQASISQLVTAERGALRAEKRCYTSASLRLL